MSRPVEATEDRRQNHLFRQVFEQACSLISPIVAANAKVKTVSNFALARMLSVNFSNLSSSEVHIVILTVEKLHRQQRLSTLRDKRP